MKGDLTLKDYDIVTALCDEDDFTGETRRAVLQVIHKRI